MGNNKNIIIVVSIVVISIIFGTFIFGTPPSPKPEVLDMEMIAMMRELYGDDLVRKEFGEAVLEECKKVEFFPDSEMRKYFPYDYEDENGYEAIEVVVYRLRKKLAQTGVTLMTLRGLGYLLKEQG